jgi:hypothetical protein
MPDINLDSLFIIGLILASLVGKIFKKKEPSETDAPKKEKTSNDSLENVLKEAWQAVTNPDQVEVRTPPSEPLPLSPEQINEIEELPLVESTSSEFEPTNHTVTHESVSKDEWHPSRRRKNSNMGKSSRQILFSKGSLKNAFVLNEILGKPVSIKPDSQNV